LNSGMAAQSAEAARIDTALPIAQQDAATFSNQRLTNQQASNAASQFGAGAENQASLVNADSSNKIVQQQLVGKQQVELANIEAQFKQSMQSNDSMARFFSQTSASIAEILKDPTISVENKNALVKKQTDLLQNYMAVAAEIGNMPELKDILVFEGTSLAATPTAPAPSQTGNISQTGAELRNLYKNTVGMYPPQEWSDDEIKRALIG
jgi:hypothetical protein